MQIDMHYYGTYAMARAAGITGKTAKIIATAAQFVDDNGEKENVECRDGARLDAEATAHHALNHKNIDREDQRKIWVPFHFLPGNQGESYTERLVCRKDSEIAREMVKHMLTLADRPYILPLMGITAHVYADTFSHYGFSGISSRRNKIKEIKFDKIITQDSTTYLKTREKEFKENYPHEDGELGGLANIKSWFAETFSGALGHGAAVTFPDRPYLKWSFTYEHPEDHGSGLRDNPATFMEGCEGLHRLFRDFAKAKPDCADDSHVKFTDIKDKITEIINLQGTKAERIESWQKASKSGMFASGHETIPPYNANIWHNERENFARERDSRKIKDHSIYRFYQAASVYRTYVLRILLPSKGLIIT